MKNYLSLWVVLIICFPGCTDLKWEAPEAGTIMAELNNRHETFSAKVIASDQPGTYSFQIHNISTGALVNRKIISAPIGYHAHAVTISWDDAKTASATIDTDFGEANKIFKLKIGNDT